MALALLSCFSPFSFFSLLVLWLRSFFCQLCACSHCSIQNGGSAKFLEDMAWGVHPSSHSASPSPFCCNQSTCISPYTWPSIHNVPRHGNPQTITTLLQYVDLVCRRAGQPQWQQTCIKIAKSKGKGFQGWR